MAFSNLPHHDSEERGKKRRLVIPSLGFFFLSRAEEGEGGDEIRRHNVFFFVCLVRYSTRWVINTFDFDGKIWAMNGHGE